MSLKGFKFVWDLDRIACYNAEEINTILKKGPGTKLAKSVSKSQVPVSEF